jgi:hypothetical protein
MPHAQAVFALQDKPGSAGLFFGLFSPRFGAHNKPFVGFFPTRTSAHT